MFYPLKPTERPSYWAITAALMSQHWYLANAVIGTFFDVVIIKGHILSSAGEQIIFFGGHGWWWGKQNSYSRVLITPSWQGLDFLSVPVKQELWFALLPRAVDDQPWSAPSIPQLDTVTVSKRRKKSVLWMDANELLAAKVLVFSTTDILFATLVSSPPLFLFAHFPFSVFPLFLLYFN